ncbi:MAG: cache domain-containing protein [Rhodocyclaceae bacterium]|nr:cache domain-containing protein [Rhodocyclaceae bacterium]
MRHTLAPRLLHIALLAAWAPIAAQAVTPSPDTSPKTNFRAKERHARALLDKATVLLKKSPKKALQAFNKPRGAFETGEYYVFAVRLNGDFLANAADPRALVGMNAADLRDAGGKPFMRELLDTARAKGGGSVDYVWLNRADNRVEAKTTLFRRVGDIVLGVGYYTPRDTREQAETLLNQAAYVLDAEGLEKAAARFNDPKGEFVKDDLYVYVVGTEDAKFYAHGVSPSLIGLNARDLRDAAGTPLVQDMLDKAGDSGSGQEDYVWRNPVTNKVESKHALFRKVGKYLVAVGYYTK